MVSNVAELDSHIATALGADACARFDADLARFHAELLRYTRSRVNDIEVAADLVQEACVRVMRYRGTLGSESLRSMLYRIINNLLADHWRRAQTRFADAHVSLDAEPIPALAPLPEDALADEERMAALKRAIMSLPPKRRQILILARLQGKSHSEIARECGITVSTVEKHLARAIVACGVFVGNQDL